MLCVNTVCTEIPFVFRNFYSCTCEISNHEYRRVINLLGTCGAEIK